jgi:hypothetical protein
MDAGDPAVMISEHNLRYSRTVRSIGLIALALTAGCVRESVPAECPDLTAGELVVTEVRGPQNPEDALGVWIELYNASGSTVDLQGTKIRFRRKDGSSEVPVIVRRSVTVPVGSYAVLGLVNDDGSRPAHIDYGFAGDFHVGFLAAAAVDIEACGTRIDLASYDVLPKTGTFSLGGAQAPDADQNDVPAAWCTNAAPEGTPKQANPPCP